MMIHVVAVRRRAVVCLLVMLFAIEAFAGAPVATRPATGSAPLGRVKLHHAATASGSTSIPLASGQTSEAGPRIWLQDSRPVSVRHAGSVGAMQTMGSGNVQPLSLAKGDLDSDGVEDLAVGYGAAGGGVLAIYRGNLDAFAPQSAESFNAIGRGDFPQPFLPDSKLIEVPVRPDFVAIGSFNGNGYPDVVVAARGDRSIYLLTNDERGNLSAPKEISVGAPITALAAGEFGRGQAYGQLVVGVSDRGGSYLMVYSGTADGIRGLAVVPCSAAVSQIEFGNFGDPGPDAAVVAGGQLFILRSSSLQLVDVSLPVSARAIALGSFIFDRSGGTQIAVLTSDGSVQIAVRSEFDPRTYTPEEFRAIRQAKVRHEEPPFGPLATFPVNGWKIVDAFPSVGTVGPTPVFFRTRVSSNGADDIMWLNAGSNRMALISHPDVQLGAQTFAPGQVSIKPYAGSPIGALPMRINIDGRPGVLAIDQGKGTPSMLMPIPDPTFFVNKFTDPVPTSPITSACNNVSNVDVSSSCSLREAVLRANALAGTDTIQLAAGTYTLTRGRITTPAYDAVTGTLNINDSVNIVGTVDGSGNPTSIITWGTLTSGNSVDMVMAVNEDISPLTNATASISNVVIQNGVNHGTHGNDGDGGCMEYDTGTSGNANLTLTNVILQNCSTLQGGGGGLVTFNFLNHNNNGFATITNSTIQNNSVVDNPSSGPGGGIALSNDSHMVMTNSKVLNNNATQVISGQKGQGGGIINFFPNGNYTGITKTTIHSSTISGNKAAGFGGGIQSQTDMLIDQGTVISGNVAGTDGTNPVAGAGGGGLYLNTFSTGCPAACTFTTTLTHVTITGNTATGDGGGISTGNAGVFPAAGALNMTFSRLAGNSVTGVGSLGSNLKNGGTTVTATNDWWGTNAASATIGTTGGGSTTFDPFIVLTHSASPAKIRINQSSTLTADMSRDNHGSGTSLSGNLDQIVTLPITFNGATLGSLAGAGTALNSSAQATATFNAGGVSGRGTANATVDSGIVGANSNLIASATESGTTVTITTVGAHNFAANETVVISGVGVGGYNGTFTIVSVPTTTTLTYTAASSGLGASSGGTATVGIIILEPPQITKSFGAATIPVNGTTTLSFSVNNPNVVAINGSFTDTLPAGLQVAATPGVTNTCGGTVTATAGAGSVSFSNNLTPIGICTISVNITGTVDNNYTNSVQILSTDAGNGNTSSANLTVINPPAIAKAFGAPTIPLNGTTSLTFTLTSTNANLTLNGVAFTDTFPAGLVVASTPSLSNTCGGTATAVGGSGSASLSGVTLAPGGSCTMSLNVQGTATGLVSNSVSASSTNGGTGATSNASLTVVGPPTISKAFNPTSVPLNGTTTLTFTINNPNLTAAGDLTGIAFSDTLPSTTGTLVVATVPNVSNTCGGTVTATAAAGVISLSGASVTHNTSCTLSVDVKGTAAGDAANTTGAITSTQGGTGTTSNTATLKVVAPPTIAKAFGAAAIAVNGTTTLTFTITNPAVNTTSENGIAFSDTLTGGLQVGSTPGVANACGGTVTAVANSTSISLSGGSIATPGSTCTVTVSVTGTVSGSVTNTTGAVSSTNGGTGATSNTANLTVAQAPSITKAFGAATVPLNGTTTLTFNITNPNTNVTLNGVAFTDGLPAGLVVAPTPNLSNTCGGTATAVAAAGSVSLSGGSLANSASCTVSLNVQGTVTGVKNNSVQVTSTEGGTGNTSNASLTVIAPPVLTKSFGTPPVASIAINGSIDLDFAVQNPNTTALSGIAFTDTLPAGLVVATPNGLVGSCGTGTITATAGANVITLSGGTLPASSTCNFHLNVTGIAAGSQVNTTSAITSTEGGTGAVATATIAVVAPPTISKAFGATSVSLNGTTTLTFTITNPSANTTAENGIAFSDTLTGGLQVGSTPGVANTCGGTVTAAANTTSISLSGGSIATPGNTCTVTVNVTGTLSGSVSNTTGAVSSTNGGTGTTSNTATLTVAAAPSITKAFGAATVPLNGTTTLTFNITNPNTNVTLSGIAFTDSLPAGLVVASTPNLTSTCGGTATAVAAAGSTSLSGGTLGNSASCSVSLNVQGTTAGVKNNSVVVTSTEGGTGNTSNASLTVVAPPALSKGFGVPPVAAIALNSSIDLDFAIQNPNATTALSGVAFTDTLPAGLVIATPSGLVGSCGTGTITANAGANVITLSGGTLPASSTCNFHLNVTGIAAGTQVNTTSAVTSTEGGTGTTATATLKVEGPPSIAKVFNPSAIALSTTTSLTFTITNPAANADPLTGVAFTDTLPTGLTVANASATVCGGTLTTTAPTGIALTGGSIAVNSQCQFSVTVTGAASGQYTNTTGAVSSTNGGTGNTASANLAVATPPTITKIFGAAQIPLNGATTLTFTLMNPPANVFSLTGLAFTDNLPAGLVIAGTPNLSNTCGGTATAIAGSGSVALSGGTLVSGASCTVLVNVQSTTAGIKNNSVTVTSTEGGTGNTSNASLVVIAPPVLTKGFGTPPVASIALNGSIDLDFAIQNPNATAALSGIAFTDTLPAGLVIATPSGLVGSCGTGTITATAGGNVITLSGGTLPATSTCNFHLNVTGIAAGSQVNTTTAVTSTEGGTGATATATLKVEGPPSIAKVFNPSAVSLNATTSLTFTITNPAANVDPLTGVAFTDTLPTGLTVANASTAVCGGTLTTTAPTGIALTGATVAASSQCQFSVTVTGAAAGQYTNTTGNVSSGNGGIGNAASANLTVATAPAITKAFGAATVPANGTTTLTFNITNPNTNVVLNGIAFTDSLPAGLVVATTPNLTNSCGGTATAVGGASSASLSAGTLAVSASCTVSLNVQGTTAGVKNNSVTVTSTNGGTGNTSNASLTVVASPVLSKSFGVPPVATIALHGSIDLDFAIQNPNTTTALSGVAFTDTLPAGLVIATPSGLVGSCGAGTISATAGTNVITLTGGTLPATSTCNFHLNVTGIAAGSQVNTTSAVTSTEGGTGAVATATIAVVAPPTLSMLFSPSSIAQAGGTTSLIFTISNPPANPVALTGVGFTVALPAGLTVTSSSASVCGGTLTTTAPSGIALAGASIGINSQCQFTVVITGTANGPFTITTSAVTSTNGGTGNAASASLMIGQPPQGPTIVQISPSGGVYGSAQLSAIVISSHIATGSVTFSEGTNVLGTAQVNFGGATLAVPNLSAGVHNIVANYGSDPVNGPAAAGPTPVTVLRAPLTVTADSFSRIVGAPNPTFTGTIKGIQNNDPIVATYTTTATQTSGAGTYAIVPAVGVSSATTTGQGPRLLPRTAQDILSNYSVTLVNGTLTVVALETGWWWDPNLNGTGFFIETGGVSKNGLFIAGLIYDAGGNATWLVSTGQLKGITYAGNWLQATGGQTLTGPYQAPTLAPAGSLNLAFSDSSHAVMTRPDGSKINLVRFSFSTNPPLPPLNGSPQVGWWWGDPSSAGFGKQFGSGTGYGIEFQGDAVFIVAYVYDASGNPVWYLATGSLTSPTSYTGTWDIYKGGPQLSSPEGTYSAQRVGSAGPLTLNFSDATHGTLTMGDVSIPITRFQSF